MVAALPLETAFHTVAGQRATNQDAVVVQDLPGGRKLFALADGMGGHQAGEVASRMALEALSEALADGATLDGAVKAANAAVHRAAMERPEWRGMGTTLVALLLAGTRYEIASVGDSRAYRIDTAGIRQITVDHSVAAEANKAGVTASSLAASPWKSAVTRAIGVSPTVEVDLFGPFDCTVPHTVVLCSDGLYRTLSHQRIRDHVHSATDLPAAVWRMTREALQGGSTDNISVVVVRFEGSAEGSARENANLSLLGDWLRGGPVLPPVDLPEIENGASTEGADAGKGQRRRVRKKRRRHRTGRNRSLIVRIADSIELIVVLVLAVCIVLLWLLM